MNRNTPVHLLPAPTEVQISLPEATLEGVLTLPEGAPSVVLFAHGSGSSRHSLRNQYVAQVLQRADLGTLLMDLLTPQEEAVDQFTRQHRFDIGLLSERLTGAIDWLVQKLDTRDLSVGLFGASTGAAAALQAAADRPEAVRAVVSRGGRPDLAGEALERVQAPTLLIVGADDVPVIPLNQAAQRRLLVANELELVPGASHLFEEPGTLERAASLARHWFLRYLANGAMDVASVRRWD